MSQDKYQCALHEVHRKLMSFMCNCKASEGAFLVQTDDRTSKMLLENGGGLLIILLLFCTLIHNGNLTKWSAIWSKIIRVISNIKRAHSASLI